MLKKVICEEEQEIEENYLGSFQRIKDAGNAAQEKLKELLKESKAKNLAKSLKKPVEKEVSEDSDSDSDASESEQSEEGKTRKPVDRLGKLTKN